MSDIPIIGEPKKMIKLAVRRSSYQMFRCDVCGTVFEGDGSDEKYKEHMANETYGEITLDGIKNPDTIECVISDLEKLDKPIEQVSDDGSLDSLLNKIKLVKKDMECAKQYVCNLCRKRSIINRENLIWSFDTLDQYDEHLFTKHSVMVNRDGNLVSAIDMKSGNQI